MSNGIVPFGLSVEVRTEKVTLLFEGRPTEQQIH
jgi:hypothetical protein